MINNTTRKEPCISMKLAERADRIKPSPTLAITAKANAMRAEGIDVISFGAGEPDFDTPDHIKEAAVAAIHEGFTKYTPASGTDELKQAVVEKLMTDNGLSYEKADICVSCGAKHSLYNLAQVLFEGGDEVIVPAPYWVSYPAIVLLADAVPVIVDTKEANGFKMTPAELEAAVTDRTRGVIINSPSNPTGTAYTRDDLRELGEIVKKHELAVISDDIYEKIMYDGASFVTMAEIDEELKACSFVVNGVSKAYSMTGWRIGYAAGPRQVIAAASKLQSQNTSNPVSISQKAALAALQGDQAPTGIMVEEFRKRRDVIVDALNGMPGVSCLKPQGAFYVFPNVSGLYGMVGGKHRVSDSASLTSYLLDVARVAVIPGDDFGNDNHIRLSYATSMENIEQGLQRIKEALGALRPA
jgi:aspartate aminotransferase